MIIETYSYPRAAVIGNPSDGYYGKTIAFVFSNFIARVQLYETPELEIKPERFDVALFRGMKDLADDVNFAGYYGYSSDIGLTLPESQIRLMHRVDVARWWRAVSPETLRADLLAAFLGALLVLPQGVAFARLALAEPE